MPTGTTDLAPIYTMLTACGFTLDKITRQPAAHWYHRTVGGMRMTVTVYPRGNRVPDPESPEPCVHVRVHDDSLTPVWEAQFRDGTPASVITAALSAAMHDAAGTKPSALPVRVTVTYPDAEAAEAGRLAQVDVQSLYTATPELDETQVSYLREVPR